jgi:hypothetical protein
LNRSRWLTLFFGPVPIVFGSMGLTYWLKPPEAAPVSSNHAVLRAAVPEQAGPEAEPCAADEPDQEQLAAACGAAAEQLALQLGEGCRVIVRMPFVIGGDFAEAELIRFYDRTIGPAARAMACSYFDTPPDKPISVLLFAGEESYNRYARQLYGDEGIWVYGYYKPHLRTLVMNIGSGGGTLVHELTHALIDFDFPRVPAWFNEGLASLHEQCHIRTDEKGIEGLLNWRLDGLQQALGSGRLRPLASLIGDNDFRGSQESLNYAQARYFCLYLQEQGVLEEFYRRFRANQKQDPLGMKTVLEVFPGRSWESLDAAFRAWAAEQRR